MNWFKDHGTNIILLGLRFVGMISLIDPPRPSVPEAVAKCRKAGIKVIMVTGDHPVTASAIAEKVGIISQNCHIMYPSIKYLKTTFNEKEGVSSSAVVITGANLREMNDLVLEKTLQSYKEIVFARTSPQQKLKIVEALQRSKLIVAVTGNAEILL